MRGIYRLAEQNIEIVTLFPETHALCAAYRTEGAPGFAVEITPSDIAFEREKAGQEGERGNKTEQSRRDGYLETLAVYRKIAERMPLYDTVLFHGSCVAVDGIGYLFTAKSGTGKSTHTRLWRELFGDRAVMINDDKPLIRATEQGAEIFGTPWNGKHHLSRNTSVPLQAICILRRAADNTIVPITPSEAYPILLGQTYRPMNADAMQRTLTLVDRLAAAVTLWRLNCNMDPSAAQTAYEAIHRISPELPADGN